MDKRIVLVINESIPKDDLETIKKYILNPADLEFITFSEMIKDAALNKRNITFLTFKK